MPPDVSPRVLEERPGAIVLTGGAVRLPLDPGLDLCDGRLPRGHVYACMAETMLLGLEDHAGAFSFGPVLERDVDWIREVADRHGFTVAGLRRLPGGGGPGG